MRALIVLLALSGVAHADDAKNVDTLVRSFFKGLGDQSVVADRDARSRCMEMDRARLRLMTSTETAS
jgi:hypothetical protein